MTRLLPTLIGFALIAAVPGVYAATAGRVQFASGDVQIVAGDNKPRAVVKGESFNEGDTIMTGANSAAQLRMGDDGVIAMRPDSRLTIETFRWSGKEDGSERSVVRLVKGGFRAITGVIGRRDKTNYLVNTATATIGIRGTDHEPLYIPPPASDETPPGPPGTYNKVNVGETFIRNDAGTIELGANTVGFAAAQPSIAPRKLDRIPDFMRGAPIPQGRPDRRNMRETAAADARHAMISRAARHELGHASPLRWLAIRTATAQGDFDVSGQGGGFQRAPIGVGLVGGLLYPSGGAVLANSGALVIDGSRGNSIIEDASNNPVIVSSSGGFRYARQGAPLVNTGSAVVDGVGVKWGVYAGGLQFDPQEGPINSIFVHFMQTSRITAPATLFVPGGATYSTVVGFTTPVDERRRIGGGVTAFSATVAFGATPMLTAYNLAVTDAGGRNWTGTLQGGPQTLGNFAGGQATPNLNTTCAGGAPACAATGAGEASGFVIGANRGGIISAYRLNAGPTARVTGSVLASP